MGKTSLAIASVLNDHARGVSSAFTVWRERRESGKVGVSSLEQKSGSNYSVAGSTEQESSAGWRAVELRPLKPSTFPRRTFSTVIFP